MKYAIIAATAILLGVALYAGIHQAHQAEIPVEVRAQFQQWKLGQNRLYGSPSEDEYRLRVFYKNLQMIEAHNAQGHSYTLGINQFADLTTEEFLAKYTGGSFAQPTEPVEYTELSTEDIPETMDWSTGSCHPSQEPGTVRELLVLLRHRSPGEPQGHQGSRTRLDVRAAAHRLLWRKLPESRLSWRIAWESFFLRHQRGRH